LGSVGFLKSKLIFGNFGSSIFGKIGFLNEKSTDNVNTEQKQYNNAQDEINAMRLPQARYW
jgi:hypothetical protein